MTDNPSRDPSPLEQRAWYAGISGYQWLVLIVASAGWIFDVFENQIFVVTRGTMLSDLLNQPVNSPGVKYYSDSINSVILPGGAVGGVLFGMLADRWGRTRSMILSILVYAILTALPAAAQGSGTSRCCGSSSRWGRVGSGQWRRRWWQKRSLAGLARRRRGFSTRP